MERKEVIVNKITGNLNTKNIDLVDRGFLASYGGMVAIGYRGGNRDYMLSVTAEDMEKFLHAGGNVALTLKELRMMEGEPVWIEVLDRPDLSRWHFVIRTEFLGLIAKDGLGQYEPHSWNEERMTFSGCYFDIEKGHKYGVNWLAYRHRVSREN